MRVPQLPTWSVHCTADEPVELLCAYAAHHLALGASEVHIYLDRPTPEAVAVLSAVPNIRVTQCDENYWQQSGLAERPAFHLGRQVFNANDHYGTCKTDWSVFCDADEFVVPKRPFAEVLADIPKEVDFARIQVAERVFQRGQSPQDIFDGVFRLSLKDREADERWAYGKVSRFLFRGLLGHNLGKTAVRTGRNRRLSAHFALPTGYSAPDRSFLQWPEFQYFLTDVYLAHFDAITPTHWLFKLMKKYFIFKSLSPEGSKVSMRGLPNSRARQIRETYRGRNDPILLDDIKKALVLDSRTVNRLTKIKGLADIKLMTSDDVCRFFPGQTYDYSIASFDARLREQNAKLIEESGFAGFEKAPQWRRILPRRAAFGLTYRIEETLRSLKRLLLGKKEPGRGRR